MKQILFIECIPNFLPFECFAMHMMTCQILVLGENTRGVTISNYVLDSVLILILTLRTIDCEMLMKSG